MSRKRPEPVQVVKQRRDAALNALVHGVPYIQFLGIEFTTICLRILAACP